MKRSPMLEMGRRREVNRSRPTVPHRNLSDYRIIVFIAFSGEEEGLIGSSYYVNHPVVPLLNTVAMINMDMIGRLKDRTLIVGGIGTAHEWRAMVDADNSVQGITVSLNARRPEDPTSGKGPIVLGANGQPV